MLAVIFSTTHFRGGKIVAAIMLVVMSSMLNRSVVRFFARRVTPRAFGPPIEVVTMVDNAPAVLAVYRTDAATTHVVERPRMKAEE